MEAVPLRMEDPLKQQKARANRYKELEPEACFAIKSGHFEGHEPVFLFPVPSHLMHFTAHKKYILCSII